MESNPPRASSRWQWSVRSTVLMLASLLLSVLPFVSLGADDLAPRPDEPTDLVATAPSPVPVRGPSVAVFQPEAAAHGEAIVQVNGVWVSRESLDLARSANQAMASLLGQPLSGSDLLERLVNAELVAQRAVAMGFKMTDSQVSATVDGLLQAGERTRAELEAALGAEGLALEVFMDYVSRLLLAETFSRAQAESLGMSQSEYIKALQDEAHIGFGPAANFGAPQAALGGVATDTPTAAKATPVVSVEVKLDLKVARGTRRGERAPAFELPALNHASKESLSLEDLAGSPLVLTFWTTWCPYCQAQWPLLLAAFDRYGPNVQFVGVNVKEKTATVQRYIDRQAIPYSIVLDADGATAGAYRVSGFPTTYFLDAEGRIVAKHVGQITESQAEENLETLLGAQKP